MSHVDTTRNAAVLAVDVGNTRIAWAVSDDDGLHDAQRFLVGDPDAWRAPLSASWDAMSASRSRAIILGSVNPPAAARFSQLADEVCDFTPIRVRDDVPFPIPLAIPNQEGVGVDRVCSAAAAHERFGGPCAVASFGTAITIDCVSAEGDYLGGVILPGLAMSCRALHEFTASLPEVQVSGAADPFGKTTEGAISAGVLLGAVGAMREVVERFATSLGRWPTLVVTGGSGPLIAEHADFVDAHVPDLCLAGVALAYRRAARTP